MPSSPVIRVPLAEEEDDSLSLSSIDSYSPSRNNSSNANAKATPVVSSGSSDINMTTNGKNHNVIELTNATAEPCSHDKGKNDDVIYPVKSSPDLKSEYIPVDKLNVELLSNTVETVATHDSIPVISIKVKESQQICKHGNNLTNPVTNTASVGNKKIECSPTELETAKCESTKKLQTNPAVQQDTKQFNVIEPSKSETTDINNEIGTTSVEAKSSFLTGHTKPEVKEHVKLASKDKMGKNHSHEKSRMFSFFKRDHKKHHEHVSDNNSTINKSISGKPGDEIDSIASDSSKKGHRRNSSLSFLDRTRLAFQNIRNPNDKDHTLRTPTETEEKMVADFMGRHPIEEESDRRRFRRSHERSADHDKAVQNVTGVGFLGPRQVTNTKSTKHGLTLANLKKKFKWGKGTPEKVPEPEPVSPPWAQQYVGDIRENVTVDVQRNDDPPPSYESMTRSPAINNFEEALKQDLTISRLTVSKSKCTRVHFNDNQLETTSYYYVSDSDLSATSVDTLTAEETGLRESTDSDVTITTTSSNRQRTILKALGKSIGGVGTEGDGEGDGDEYFLNKGITDDGCMFSFWSDKKSATSSPRLFRKPYSFDIIEPDGSTSHPSEKLVTEVEVESTIFYGKKGKKPNLKPLFSQDKCPYNNYNCKTNPISSTCDNAPFEKPSCDIVKTTAIKVKKLNLTSPLQTQTACQSSDTTSSESINDSGYFHGSFDSEVNENKSTKSYNKMDKITSPKTKSVAIYEHDIHPNCSEDEVGEITVCYQSEVFSEPTPGPKHLYSNHLYYVSIDDNSEVCGNELKPEVCYLGDVDQNACTEETDISVQLGNKDALPKPISGTASIEEEVGKVSCKTLEVSLTRETEAMSIAKAVQSIYLEEASTDPPDSNSIEAAVLKCEGNFSDTDDSDDTSTLMMSDSSCMLRHSGSSDEIQEHPTVRQKHITKQAATEGLHHSSDSAVDSNTDSSDLESGTSLENCNNSNSNESLLDIDNEDEIIVVSPLNFGLNTSMSGSLSDISENTHESSLDDDGEISESESSNTLVHRKKSKEAAKTTTKHGDNKMIDKQKRWRKLLTIAVGV